MTAPRRELSPGLISRGYAESMEAVTKRHDEYNQIVREVAAELNAPLLDLARSLEGPEFDSFFAHDGVHFDSYATEHVQKPDSQPGLEYIADALHQKLKTLVP
jgi:lysophospholipase L1-like esterase